MASSDVEPKKAAIDREAEKSDPKEIEALGLELDTDHHEAVARFDAGKEK